VTDSVLQDPVALASCLNEACQCVWVDRARLRGRLQAELGDDAEVLETREGLVSGSVVFVEHRHAQAMDRAIRLITAVLSSTACRSQVQANAPAIARQRELGAGSLLGFDFHLGGPAPQLIEINTNPGGLLVCLELARAATASCDCLGLPLPMLASAGVLLDQFGPRVIESFASAWSKLRGAGAPLAVLAIVDDAPREQYLYPEFLLYRRLFERAGWRVQIVDPAELTTTGDALWHQGERIDMVYNRLTDFYLVEERHAALRRAYEHDLAVVVPHPAAHAHFADKRLLAWLKDERLLAAAGLDRVDRAFLRDTIPATEIVEPAAAEQLWARRKGLFFKPIDGYAGKAAYRGDKITRRAFEHVLANRYVAQALVPTSSRHVQSNEGEEVELRVDIRNYVVQGETWLRAARLYRGQTTNFRTAGGGFAPVLTLPA
jgi:hypothetical protein